MRWGQRELEGRGVRERAPGLKQGTDSSRANGPGLFGRGRGGAGVCTCVQVCARAGRTAASRGAEHTPITRFGKDTKQ